MYLNFNNRRGLGKVLFRNPRFVNFFEFHTQSISVISTGNLVIYIRRFPVHNFARGIICALFSSFSSRLNSNVDSSVRIDCDGVSTEPCGSYDNRYGSDRKTGEGDIEALNHYGNFHSDVENENNSKFDNFGDAVDSDEEEEEECEDPNGGLMEFNSFNRNQKHQEEFPGVEIGEDDFRHPLVGEACKLIQLRSSWNPKLEGELRHLLRILKPRQVCAVLKSLEDERVALQLFYWGDRLWRYRHDPIVYYVMLEILSKTKMCQGAKRVLRLMTRRGIHLWPEAFGYVMVSYSRAGKLKDALKILTLMQKAGVDPNLSICNTTIHVLVIGNELEKALKFLKRMILIGITPNVVTYNCLIKGYCDLHRVEDALELIDEMPLKGCFPDKVSYYTVMGFLCKYKRVKEVKQLMEKMVTVSNLLVDPVTYNTLIHILSKHGHGEEALEFLREAEKMGFRIDKVGFSAIVHSFCKEGKLDMAKEIVAEMFSKGCLPDVVTYTAVLNGYCRIGKIDQAKKILEKMYKHGCRPNTVSYTALIHGLCCNGNSLEAREMMKMSEVDCWTPNAITYTVVMHGLRKEGKLHEACNMINEMIEKGFIPNPVEINLLIQSLCRDGKESVAKRLMEECMDKGCAINVVNFTTLIHGFCQKDDLESALSLLEDMYLRNKHPDAVTYTAVIDALAKKGRIEEATELTLKMLKKGLDPSPVTYRSVIHRYCQMGRVDDLMKLLEKMFLRQKFRTAYNQVIEKLCSFGFLEEASRVLGEVLRTASKDDRKTCHVLIESYLKKGLSLSAYQVACRMFNRSLIPDLKLCEKVTKGLIVDGKLEEADRLMLRFVEHGCISPQHQEQLHS